MKPHSKYLFPILFAVLSFMPLHAQTDALASDFVEAVKSYVNAAPYTFDGQKEQLLKLLTQLNKSIAPELDDDNSQQYVEEYLNEKFVDDIAEKLLAKGINGLVSTEDLRALGEAMQTPEGKDLRQKMVKISGSQSAAWEDFGKMVVMQLMSGNDPEPLELNSKIPESYKSLFKEYYDKSGLASPFTSALKGLRPLLNSAGVDGLADRLVEYFDINLPVLYLNSWYETISEDNLRFALKLADMPAYKSVTEATANMMKNLPQAGMTIVQSYVEWLKGKGVNAALE